MAHSFMDPSNWTRGDPDLLKDTTLHYIDRRCPGCGHGLALSSYGIGDTPVLQMDWTN